MKNFILWKVVSQNYVKKKHFSSQNNSGFTLFELLISLLMGTIILGSALGGFISLRQLLAVDRGKNDVNQRLRTLFGIIGPDIVQIGEGLTDDPQFPVLEVDTTMITNTGQPTSTITIRKADLVGSLTLCSTATSGDTIVNIIDTSCNATDGNNDGWPDDVREWQVKRLDQGGTIRAYIFDSATENSEFFDYTGEQALDSTNASVTPSATVTPDIVNLTTSTLQDTYNAGTSVVYLVEERKYSVNDDTRQMQLVINENETLNLVERIYRMDITVNLQESIGEQVYACESIPPNVGAGCVPGYPSSNNYTWDQIKSINVLIHAQAPLEVGVNRATSLFGEDDLILTQEFFPRNRLSF